ncbi:hypothetical protein XENORESO_018459 [Xenotaenia resolanae]|uniref:Uncharacterized protein n=1 Tax=Xenotaenia resolanae TaxID=208358 RepID=A0ABV0WKZ9_9TELE
MSNAFSPTRFYRCFTKSSSFFIVFGNLRGEKHLRFHLICSSGIQSGQFFNMTSDRIRFRLLKHHLDHFWFWFGCSFLQSAFYLYLEQKVDYNGHSLDSVSFNGNLTSKGFQKQEVNPGI